MEQQTVSKEACKLCLNAAISQELGISSPPGCNSSPSQGLTPSHEFAVPIYTPKWREALSEPGSVIPKNKTRCPYLEVRPGPLDPEASAHTTRPRTAIRASF